MTQSPEENRYLAGKKQESTSKNDTFGALTWWYHVSGPPEAPESASFTIREQTRRARVASLLILGTICAALLLVSILIVVAPTTFILSQILIVTGIGIACCLFAILLNRKGNVLITGLMLIIAVDVIVAGVILSEKNGLDPLVLSMFDLLAVAELIAASLLAPSSVFTVAFLNVMLVVADINLQPHSMMWMQMIPSQQLVYSLVLRPVILYFVVAAVAYLWVTSALNALKRADRAELIAELERREAERSQQIEEAVEEILSVHVRVANGDLNARAPVYQNKLLWQIGLALNNLLARFKAASQAERGLKQVDKEVADLRMLLRQWRPGQPLRWYPHGQSMLGPLVEDFRYVLTPELVAPPTPRVSPPPPAPTLPARARQRNPGHDPSWHGISGSGRIPHNAENEVKQRIPGRDPSWHGISDSPDNSGSWPHIPDTPYSTQG